MAQVANTPTLPLTPRSPRVEARTAPLEERVAVLEAHRESLTPQLATKADVKGAENRMILWILGAGLALAGLGLAMFARLDSAMTSNLARLDSAMTSNIARLDSAIAANTARIDKLDAKIDARFDALLARQDKLDARMDRLDEKLDARFDAIMAELRALNRAQ